MTPIIDIPKIKIAFIGGGNMATAMIGGLIRHQVQPNNLMAIDPLEVARYKLIATYGINVAENISQAEKFLMAADLIIYAVKPQQLRQALTDWALLIDNTETSALLKPSLILSIVAGVQMQDFSKHLGHERIIRAMPNTPALISQGMTGLYSGKDTSENDKALIEFVCSATGDFIWVESETLIDAVTAVSGSGPAYIFQLIEHMQKAGVNLGLSPNQALKLSIKTIIGAANLAQDSTDSPTVLREKVTSKGGTTYAALEVLRQNDWGRILEQAISAAHDRSQIMGQEFSKD